MLVANLSRAVNFMANGMPQIMVRNHLSKRVHKIRPLRSSITHRDEDSVRAKKLDRAQMFNQMNQIVKICLRNQNKANPKHVKRKGHRELLDARSDVIKDSWLSERELVVPA
jgi:hypothetical protein